MGDSPSNRTPARGIATLRTERLLLRAWCDDDREPFAAMCADAEVMEHFPSLLSRAESDGFVDRMGIHFEQHGFGLWALEIIGGARFAGFVGLMHVNFEAHFTPAIEIGWRLSRATWGHGYATEAARASLDFAFTRERREEIVAMTTPANTRSRRVMDRIGMTHDPRGDFDHPRVPIGHPMRRAVLYRIQRARWDELVNAR